MYIRDLEANKFYDLYAKACKEDIFAEIGDNSFTQIEFNKYVPTSPTVFSQEK